MENTEQFTQLPEDYFTMPRADRRRIARGHTIIWNQQHLLEAIKLLKARTAYGKFVLKFSLDGNGGHIPVVEKMGENPILRELASQTCKMLDGDAVRVVEGYTDEFIKVEPDMKRRYQFEAGIWVYNAGDGKTCGFLTAGKNRWQNMLTREITEYLPFGCIKYVVHPTPSSGLRNETILYHREDHTEFIISELNRVTSGAYELLVGHDVTLGSGNKYGGRISGYVAPSRNWGPTKNYAIKRGKWVNGLIDGTSFASAEFIAEILSKLLGITVMPQACCGLFVQDRKTGVAKCSTTVIPRKMLRKILELHGGEAYGDVDNIDVLMDENALKADFDFGREINFEVLDIAKFSPAHTSIQVLRKLASCGIDRKEMLLFARDLFREETDQALENIKAGVAQPPTLSMFKGKNLAAKQITGMMCPDLVLGDRVIFKNVVGDGYLRTMVNNANMLRHKIEGGFGRLQADIGILFGERLLKFGEVFLPGQRGKDWRGRNAEMFKYPTIGLREKYSPIILSVDDMVDRVGKTEWDIETRRMVIEYFRCLQDGVIVVPAIAQIMNLLAGCDYDWDGALLIVDQRFVQLASKCKSLIVNIDTSGEVCDETIVGKFSLDLMPKLTYGTLYRQKAGSTVGKITQQSDRNDALLTAPYNTKAQAIRRIFKSMPNKGQNYVGLRYYKTIVDGVEVDAVDITPADIRKVYDEIRHSEVTPESVDMMLADMNVVFRMLQELTIDSVKTGVFVKPPVDYSAHVNSRIQSAANVVIDWGTSGSAVAVRAQ